MDRKLVWTEKASSDIEAIVRYIGVVIHALPRVSDSVSTIVRRFALHPKAGSILEELQEGGWRKLIFRRWKIVYTIRADDIIIGRVWPAAIGEADLETPL